MRGKSWNEGLRRGEFGVQNWGVNLSLYTIPPPFGRLGPRRNLTT